MERTCNYFPVGLLLATCLVAIIGATIITDKSTLVTLKDHIVYDPHLIFGPFLPLFVIGLESLITLVVKEW